MEIGGAYDRQWAEEFDDCVRWFLHNNMDPFPKRGDHSLWCNATWDGVLCWPAIPAATKYTLKCPSDEGFDIEKNVTKHCHFSGRWLGEMKGDFSRHQGFTDYSPCYAGQTQAEPVNVPRILSYIGFVFSIISIVVVLVILIVNRSRRYRLNQMRMCLLGSLLLLYIFFLSHLADEELSSTGGGFIYINEKVCRAFIFMLEFSRFLAGSWLLANCFHGFNETFSERVAEHCLSFVVHTVLTFIYAIVGSAVWMYLMIYNHPSQAEFACYGDYKTHHQSSVILLFGNLFLLVAAGLSAILHVFCAIFKQLVTKTSRFSGFRWLLQAVIHLLMCSCFAALWYFDLWYVWNASPDAPQSSLHKILESIVRAFTGFAVAILIGLAQSIPIKIEVNLIVNCGILVPLNTTLERS